MIFFLAFLPYIIIALMLLLGAWRIARAIESRRIEREEMAVLRSRLDEMEDEVRKLLRIQEQFFEQDRFMRSLEERIVKPSNSE